ncbi:MAG: 5-formyltetrahydrofolate cyclo-ligase [Pseudomonadota bacterium]
MPPPIRSFFDPKHVWRERMKITRRAAADKRPDAARHAARVFLDAIPIDDNAIVALYHPIRDELDTEPLAAELIGRGIAIALPVAARKPAPLVFRAYAPGDELKRGAFGEMVPSEDAAAVTPHIIVAPLLGYTRRGDRLGYGGGYYDRTLAALRAESAFLAVGYAFADQEVDALPVSPLDHRLDWIVTERGAMRCAP